DRTRVLGLAGGAHRGEDPSRPQEPRELDRIGRHRAGAPGDEAGRPIHGTVHGDRVVGGQRGNPEIGARLEAGLRIELDGLLRRKHDEFGSRAERPSPLRIPDPDTLPDTSLRYAFAHPIDDTRSVTVRNHPRPRHGAGTGPGLPVGGVHAGCGDAYPHFTGTGDRVRHFTYGKDVPCRSVRFVPGCLHSLPRTCSCGCGNGAMAFVAPFLRQFLRAPSRTTTPTAGTSIPPW